MKKEKHLNQTLHDLGVQNVNVWGWNSFDFRQQNGTILGYLVSSVVQYLTITLEFQDVSLYESFQTCLISFTLFAPQGPSLVHVFFAFSSAQKASFMNSFPSREPFYLEGSNRWWVAIHIGGWGWIAYPHVIPWDHWTLGPYRGPKIVKNPLLTTSGSRVWDVNL